MEPIEAIQIMRRATEDKIASLSREVQLTGSEEVSRYISGVVERLHEAVVHSQFFETMVLNEAKDEGRLLVAHVTCTEHMVVKLPPDLPPDSDLACEAVAEAFAERVAANQDGFDIRWMSEEASKEWLASNVMFSALPDIDVNLSDRKEFR